MRALRTCDFCGGEAVGAFEIVPDELDPTEREQRRVVLCDGCRARLEDLLEPLLARAGADTDGDDAASNDAGDEGGDDASVPGNVEIDSDERASKESESADDGSGVDSEPASTHGPDADDAREEEPIGDSPSAARTDDPDDGGVAFEREEGSTQAGAEVEGSDPGRAGGLEGDRTTEGDSSDSSVEAPEGSDSADAAGPSGSAGSPPPAYGSVLRLLRNREFPMDRAAVESLAAGAYDLEGPQVEAIVDHAIAEGELVADGDQLRRA